MTRSSNGAGSWRQTATGWEYRRQVDGQTVSVTARTKTDARTRMDEKVDRIRRGQPKTDAKITVGDLLQQWQGVPLDARSTRRGPLKESTKAGYRTLIECYIVGRKDDQHPDRTIAPDPIAGVRLDRLKQLHVEGLVARLRERKLGESTIRTVYHVLRLALDHAVDNDMIAKHPMAKMNRPVVPEAEPAYLSPAQVLQLLTAARQYRYHEALELIAGTGMRRGEALALKWADVDLVEGTVDVHGTLARINGELVVTATKTAKSQRRVHLSPALVDSLAALKDRQEAEAAERDGMVIVLNNGTVPAWTDTGFVFTTETGQPVDPRNVFRTLQWAAKKAGIQGVGIHTLRHSWASAAVNGGIPLPDVQEVLGHADLDMTRHYVHTEEARKKDATIATASLFGL